MQIFFFFIFKWSSLLFLNHHLTKLETQFIKGRNLGQILKEIIQNKIVKNENQFLK